MERRTLLAQFRDALRDHPRLSPAAKLAGFVISTYADSRGVAYPSKVTIAAGMGAKSTRTADVAVRELTANALLYVKAGGGRGHSNAYQLAVPETPQSGAGFAAQKGQQDAGLGEETPHDVAGIGTRNPAIGGRKPRSRTSETPQPAAPESSMNAKAKAVTADEWSQYDE